MKSEGGFLILVLALILFVGGSIVYTIQTDDELRARAKVFAQRSRAACDSGDLVNCEIAVSKTEDPEMREILQKSYRIKTGSDLPKAGL